MASFKATIPPAGVEFVFNPDKDPSDVIDYEINWTPLLQSDGIASITIAGKNVTIDSSSFTGKFVTIFVSGGTDGNIGTVTMTIVTTNSTPRTYERSFPIKIEEK